MPDAVEGKDMKILSLEQAVVDLRTGYEELRAQVEALRALIVQDPVDPLEERFQSFKGRVGDRRAAAQRTAG